LTLNIRSDQYGYESHERGHVVVAAIAADAPPSAGIHFPRQSWTLSMRRYISF